MKADPLVPVKASDDYSSDQHLDCNLMRGADAESCSLATQIPDPRKL